ncbi:MAG: hypothetical protein NVS1B11_01870 [Terriglobales bacterium]
MFGNFPRISGEVRSQRYFNEDFSIIKRTLITESTAVVLKAELFNAFNRHIFSRPDTGPTDSTFGAVFGTVDTHSTERPVHSAFGILKLVTDCRGEIFGYRRR